jgi:hypothetical protein
MSTEKGNLSAGAYWTGMAMTLVCLALTLAGNTGLIWRFEHRSLPLSWAFGCAAIFAFLVCEFCQRAFPNPAPEEANDWEAWGTEERVSPLTPAWESAQSISE